MSTNTSNIKRHPCSFDAVLTDLIENFDLLSATELVLSGCSAGASGVLYSCDHLAGRLAGSAAGSGLRCVADAPDYYPADVTGTPDCETRQAGYVLMCVV